MRSIRRLLIRIFSAAVMMPVLVLMSAAAFSGCAQQTADVAENAEMPAEKEGSAPEISWPLTLKAGYSTSEEDPRGAAIRHFKEKVEAETNGRILIDIYPSGELGSDAELIAGLISGDVDITVSSAGNYALYATRMGVSALPFLFNDFESAWDFIDSDTMSEISLELEPYNMHVLSYFDNGFRCVTTTNRPIYNTHDMWGLNIRTPDNQIVMETMSELGANPKSYPFTKLKEALQNGEFNAQENPIPVIYNNGLYEVQGYLAITNHSYDAMPLTIRQDIWEQLPPEHQEILTRAALEAQDMNRKMVARQTTEYVSLLEEAGMKITYPDLKNLKAATKYVMDVFSDVYGEELLAKIKEVYS